MSLDELVREALSTRTFKSIAKFEGGSICEVEAYVTDQRSVVVKRNSNPEAKLMFDGEFQSLMAIRTTKTVTAPKPLKVLENPSGGAALIMDFVEMQPLNKHSAKLGEQLARMHLHNRRLLKHADNTNDGICCYQPKFGFHCTTCCGYLPQNNSWCDDWVVFYTHQKLQPQIEWIQQKYGNREVGELWVNLEPIIPQFFKYLEIHSSLLHGDLWEGNVKETEEGPVVFDAACFYGHDEFDISMSQTFGGFSSAFFEAYHSLIPKAPGFEERLELYKLFHYLNHWNHFEGDYEGSSLSTMKALINLKK